MKNGFLPGEEPRNRRTPMVLLPYQQRWIADQSPVKVGEKSRRIGFSWAEASDDVTLAASANGMDVWYIGYNKEMALEFIEDCADWTRHISKATADVEEIMLEDEDKDILSYRIRYASGYKIVALSSRPSNLRGKDGKAVIDEAAFHDDLPGLMKAALAFLMWGGRVVIFSSHNGDANPFNELVKDILSGKKPFSLHRVTLDDALKDGLYQRICLRLGLKYTKQLEKQWRQALIDFYGDDADEELFCVPAQGDGAWMTRMLYESCISPASVVLRHQVKDEFTILPEEERTRQTDDWIKENLKPVLDCIPKDRNAFIGEDFGRTGHLTVIWVLISQSALKCHTPLIVELHNMPHDQQKQILFYIIEHFNKLKRFRAAALDARGNGHYLAETTMQKYGADRVEEVMLSETWYRENMSLYKTAYEDKTITAPDDEKILDDHRDMRMVKGVPKPREPKKSEEKNKKSKMKRHCDATIAGAFAWFAFKKKDPGPIEFKAIGGKHISADKQMNRFMGRSH